MGGFKGREQRPDEFEIARDCYGYSYSPFGDKAFDENVGGSPSPNKYIEHFTKTIRLTGFSDGKVGIHEYEYYSRAEDLIDLMDSMID